jgi:hypothetical protein
VAWGKDIRVRGRDVVVRRDIGVRKEGKGVRDWSNGEKTLEQAREGAETLE